MKKPFLLACAMMLGVAQMMQAENKIYTYSDGGMLYFGMMNRISDNGRWAVGTDDGFQTGSFIIDTQQPEEIIDVMEGELYDISNDGVAVGTFYENIGTEESRVNEQHAAIYKDGQWMRLSEPLTSMGRSYARSVSSNGRYIGGMAFCAASNSEMGATYYPCLWTRNDETGDYDLTCYNNMKLPGNMGFYVNDMSNDGQTLVGLLYTDAGGTVPAMVQGGELVCWNKMEWKLWPFEYDGKISYYEQGFVDGVLEGATASSWFNGSFNYLHDNYVFGHRSVASDVNPETGEGTVTHNRCIYNLLTGEFVDEPSSTYFTCGFDDQHAFMTTASEGEFTSYYLNEGAMRKVNRQFGLQNDMEVAVIYGSDHDGRVFAGSTVWFNEAIGSYCESPLLIVLDDPVLGIDDLRETLKHDGKIYDLSGRQNPNGKGIRIVNGKKVLKK